MGPVFDSRDKRYKDPFGAVACSADIRFALEDETYFQTCCASICQSRAWAAGELERLGFTVLPSRANFLFVRSPKIGGEDLYRSLTENGILVRWFDSPRIRDFVRITVGDLEQMHTLIDQVEQLLDAL